MIPQFKGLHAGDQHKLFDAIPLITVLIAGADGTFDKDEMDWAEKVTHIRSYAESDESLKEYYQKIGATYHDDLIKLIDSLPKNIEEREVIITERLVQLNDIFPKIEDSHFAYRLYKSMTSFARHVAKASGGFLGIGSIRKVERDLMDLPMITPIVWEEQQ